MNERLEAALAVRSQVEEEVGVAVYPGHPLTCAYFALRYFGSVDAALEPGDGPPALVCSPAVPGSGNAARNAADLLARSRAGESLESLAAWADEVYAGTISREGGVYQSAIGPGIEQARLVYPLLRNKLVELALRV